MVSKLTYSFDKGYARTKDFNTPFEFYVNGSASSYGSTIKLSQDASDNQGQTLQFTMDYNKTIGNHTLGALFVFEQSGVENGQIIGRLRPTGLRPKFMSKIEASGIHLPPSIFGIGERRR